MRIKISYILVVLIILIAIGLRIFVLLNTDHLDGFSVWEISNCYGFSPHPFNFFQYWRLASCTTSQLGHYFINAILMHFLDEPVLISRMISFIFGILTIIPYYLLVKLVFSQEIALASIFALAFYPIHVQISVVSFANAGSLFFVILALYFLTQYLYQNGSKKRKSKFYFTGSIISTILATAFRLDSWFVPFIFTLLFLHKKRLKEALLFLVSSSFYIVVTIYMFYKIHRNPLPFLSYIVDPSRYKGILRCFSGSGDTLSFDKHQFFIGLKTIMDRFLEPSFYQGIFKIFSSRIEVSYSKYQALIWFNTLFYTLSLYLSVLGFLGMLIALKHKKQYIFLVSFWSFFVILTVKQFMDNQSFRLRYSHLFVIFFIPFIFLGISEIGLYICRLFRLNDVYKKVLAISLIIIGNIYFTFFSANFLIKMIPEMKFSPLLHNISAWAKKNVHSQDMMFFSFDTVLYLPAVTTFNKFIDIYYGEQDLYNALISNKESILDRETIEGLVDFVKRFNQRVPGSVNGSGISVLLLGKKGQSQEIKRIVFILDERVHTYLKDNYPDLLKKLEIKYDGIFYSGVLPLCNF